jgi:hypothetical protein
MALDNWTVADLVQHVPVGYWWWIGSTLCAVFGAGYGIARLLQSRQLENTQADLATERAKPKVSIVLGAADKDVGDIAHLLRYSFSKPEYIYPEIVEELEGWISDGLPVYAAVDLEGAMRSNRFFLPPENKRKPGEGGWMSVEKKSEYSGDRNPYYGYKYIGVTPSGTHIIQTASSGGGSGIFCSVLFMRFQTDEVLTGRLDKSATRSRILLRCIGERPLGDRYSGQVSYADGVLAVGAGSRNDIGVVPVEETKIQIQ